MIKKLTNIAANGRPTPGPAAHAITTLVAIASMVLFGLAPMRAARTTEQRIVHEADTTETRHAEATERITAATGEIDRHRARLDALGIEPPTPKELNNDVAAILDTAEAAGLSITDVGIGDTTPSQPFVFASIRVGATARPEAVASLLDLLPDRHPYVALKSLQVRNAGRRGTADGPKPVQLDLELTWKGFNP